MRTLWGRLTSINVQKVAWVLNECGLDHDVVEVGGHHKGTDTADYLSMNPTGRVPTLLEGELALWESNAICRYLVDAHGGPLSAPDPASRGQADMWMEWFQNGPYAPFIQVFYQSVRLPLAERSGEKLDTAMQSLERAFAIAEAELSRRPYLSGKHLGLGDIPFGACLYRYFTIDVSRSAFPAIESYYERLCDRPAYRNAVMVDYSSLRPDP